LTACVIRRVRLCVPEPHVTVHVSHVEYGDTVQSTGQEPVLHIRDSLSAPHATPPKATARDSLRWRICSPPPQVAVHGVQSPKEDATQSTGQFDVLHTWVSSICKHCLPPKAGYVSTLRERVRSPVPHVREHAPQSPNVSIAQSTGQFSMWHPCVSCMSGHTAFWNSGRRLIVRVCEPPPHVLVHVLHAEAAVMAQSHASVLQLRDSRRSLGQTLPPKAEPLLTVRERMETPPPHVLEHGAQSDHSEAEQSTGQLCALQTRTSASVGQLLPPCATCVMTVRSRS
jgi:hypothetical protein